MVRPSYTKSKNVLQQPKRQNALGDTSDLDSDTDLEDEQRSVDFCTPDKDSNATDYGLQFTHNASTPRRFSAIRKSSRSMPRLAHRNAASLGTGECATPTTSKNNASTAKGQRKQPKPMKWRDMSLMQKDQYFWRDVLRLQNLDKFLIPRLSFSRLVREIIRSTSENSYQVTREALEALQTASEMYVTQRLQDSYLLTLHRGRITLNVKDMVLINFLRSRDT